MSHRDAHLPADTRRILHLDVDAFLASVEQALHPELAGRPLVIGGAPTSRNLVMSCSYEARARGVRPGMRSSEAARLCPRAIFRPGDSRAANVKRGEITRLLLEYSPRVEVASIDDFFVDLTGSTRLLGAACEVAVRVRTAIRERTHMPVTVGIGTSRTLARLAGKLAKPGGVAEILPGHERAFLSGLPVRHLPGVGHRVGTLLEKFSIHTVGELALVGRELLFATFGPLGLDLYERARGIDDEPVETTHTLDEDDALIPRPPRSIRRDSTLEPEEGRRDRIEGMLDYLVERAALRLRQHACRAGSMEVRITYVDGRPPHLRATLPDPGRSSSRRRRLPEASHVTAELSRHARTLLDELPRRRALVKRVGVSLLNLSTSAGRQGQLFSDPLKDRPDASHADREHRLDTALDELRQRHGFGRVLRGSSLPLLERFPLEPDGLRLRTPSLNQ